MSTYISWIEQSIKEGHIKYYEYENFQDVVKIGYGGLGLVYRATRKQHNFALKSFNNFADSIVKEIISEV